MKGEERLVLELAPSIVAALLYCVRSSFRSKSMRAHD